MNKNVTIRILTKEFVVGCPAENEADLLASASYLNSKMLEIQSSGKILGLERIAVMAALNISNELLSSKVQQREQMEDTMQRLSQKIDKSLASDIADNSLALDIQDSQSPR
ncbi:MAG: cell division protein ZapA [Pseudomonadales bacterium]|nr:cell division protein ZapA [Pseudomonadales bacterium]MCJ8340997.1 cell division protein ZapA [Pseudomonadales bacterium]NRA18633.1 cell division protein ZapA [Oceanospirillaceae bacterium]